jgi:hypothetical protein
MAEEQLNPLESLQNKLDSNTLNPREYNPQQLQTIDGLIEQGVLKGPRMNDIVKSFQETESTIATEKEFAQKSIRGCIKR